MAVRRSLDAPSEAAHREPDEERLARAIHEGRITVAKHGKFTDRCICNYIARDILRGLHGLLPKPNIEHVIAEYVSDPLQHSVESQAIPYETEAAHPSGAGSGLREAAQAVFDLVGSPGLGLSNEPVVRDLGKALRATATEPAE